VTGQPRDRAGERGRGAPLLLAVPAAIGFAFLFLPLLALLVRAPWRGLGRLLSGSAGLTALRLSLECATAATVLSVLFGVPLAWVLARVRLPGIGLLRAVVLLPLVLPPVVGGLALLLALGRNGVFGRYGYQAFGYSLPFTTAGVRYAWTTGSRPFSLRAQVVNAFAPLGYYATPYGPLVPIPPTAFRLLLNADF